MLQTDSPDPPLKTRTTAVSYTHLLGAAITLHAIYNLLIAYGGAAQYVAYALPVLLVAAGRWSVSRLSRKQ